MSRTTGDGNREAEASGGAPQARGGRGARPTGRRTLLLALLAVTLAVAWWEYRKPIPPIPEPQTIVRLQTREAMEEHAGTGQKIRAIYDLPYSYRPGIAQEELAMDLFVPPAARNCPVLVYLHGGGWMAGNKNGIGPKSLYFASRGILVASVNYRLCYPRPGQHGAIDVGDAIRFLHREIGRFGGDPERIFLMGHSAGAHLAALTICDDSLLADKDPAAAKAVRGAILLDGSAYDVPAMMASEKGEDFAVFFGHEPADWLALSPYHHAVGRTGLPPMMLVHAGEEPVRKMAAERLAAALRAGGAAGWPVDMPERDHYSVDGMIGEADDPLTPMIERFIADR